MLKIELPNPRFHDVALEPEAKVRQLAANTALLNEPPLRNQLSLAEPIVVPVTAKEAYKDQDPLVADFIDKQKDQRRYYLVHFACSFAPSDGEPINRAWVIVKLRVEKNSEPAVVISMAPRSVSDIQEIKQELKASASFELLGGKLTLEGGKEDTKPNAELFMYAKDVGHPNVAWVMKQTAKMKIGGIYDFNLIVQAPAGQAMHGVVDSQVEIKRKFFGLVTYNAMLDEHPSSKFICSMIA